MGKKSFIVYLSDITIFLVYNFVYIPEEIKTFHVKSGVHITMECLVCVLVYVASKVHLNDTQKAACIF